MRKISRRNLLRLMAISTAGVGLAACTPAATPAPTAAPQNTAASVATDTPPAAATAAPQPTTAPTKGAAVKITMVESWFGLPQFTDSIDPVTKAISDKMQSEGLNITIQSMILDDHAKKYPVLYTSGADFTMAFDAPWYRMTGLRDQGALATLEDLVGSVGPNLKKEITDKIWNANFMGGHMYGIPTAYYYSGTCGVMLREDLRTKYSAAAPTSDGGYPSLEPFLQAIKKNETTMIPYALASNFSLTAVNVWGRNSMQAMPGPQTSSSSAVVIPDWTKGYQFQDFETIPQYQDLAKLLRSWWQQGLVNKTDLPSSAGSQNVEPDYLYPGKAASCQENEPDYKYVDMTKSQQSSIKDATLKGYDLTGMRANKVKGTGQLVQGNFIVFNANAPKEQQQAGIQYFDWLTQSQDNMDLWFMGIEGKNWKKEDNLKFSEIAGVDAARNYRRQWYVSGISGRFQRQVIDLPKDAQDALTFFSTETNFQFNPYEQFTPDTKALETDIAQLTGVLAEAFHGLDTGQDDTTAALAKCTKLLDDAGRQTFKQKLQKQLDDYMKAHPATS